MATEGTFSPQTCRLLGVSCSGYYAAVKRWQRTPTVLPEEVHLKAAFVDSGKVYGSRRLKIGFAGERIQNGALQNSWLNGNESIMYSPLQNPTQA